MHSARHVGRIGGLAVALGVGAAVFTGNGIACAAPATGSSDSSGTTDTGTTAKESKTTLKDKVAAKKAAQADKKADQKSDSAGTDSTDTDTTKPKITWSDIFGGSKKDASDSDSAPTTDAPAADADSPAADQKPGRHRLFEKAAKTAVDSTPETSTDATDPDAKLSKLKTWLSNVNAKAEAAKAEREEKVEAAKTAVTTTLATVTSSKSTTAVESSSASESESAEVATPLASFVKKLFDAFSGNSPSSPAAGAPFAWMLAAASRRELAAAAEGDTVLTLNGYNVVATGEPLEVGSYYGMFTHFPGFMGVVQGEQDFELVDPKTNESVGSFTGVVSQNKAALGGTYTQIVVTGSTPAAGHTIGTEAGVLPAVGATISNNGGRFGTVYSALPTGEFNPDGTSINKVSYVRVTPFGTFRLGTPYDASKTLTDGFAFNRSLNTSDGYTIVPLTPGSAEITAVTGLPPFFQAVQGQQVYKLVDSTGATVGTFSGYTTVTSDVLGTYTEAIYVNKTLTGDVGSQTGQVPPVGSVYNVIYFHSDDQRVVYSSKPDAAGDVIKTVFVRKGKTTDLDFTFDASKIPERSFVFPGDYILKPVGDLQVVGINGLPPRENILQGYQNFEIYDGGGHYLGTVTADRTSQWDVSDNGAESILVTSIVDTNPDLDGLPPVGSVFNFSYTKFGASGGQAYYALPGQDGARDKVNYKFLLSPYLGIPLLTTYDAAKGMGDYDYYVPPLADNMANVFSLAATSGGVLGASQCAPFSSGCVSALAG